MVALDGCDQENHLTPAQLYHIIHMLKWRDWKMTVSELIESLQQFDPTLAVLVRGYEGGYEYVTGSSEKPMLLDVHSDRDKEWYYGPHEIADEYYGEIDKDGKKREQANCVLIG